MADELNTRYEKYFSTNPLSCNWFDIVNPDIILSLSVIDLGNPTAIRNYICKFRIPASEYFVRFTIRKIGLDSSVHASTISKVSIYRKTEGIPADSHLENPEDGHGMPFIDHKIAHYLSACQPRTLS